jgi:nicotinic acid phosphoribosyltransferase
MIDKYHITSLLVAKELEKKNNMNSNYVVFELFFRDNKTYYIGDSFPDYVSKKIEETNEFVSKIAGEFKLHFDPSKIKIKILNKNKNRIVEVKRRYPLIRVESEGLEGIVYETPLLNFVQSYLIYFTRLYEIKKTVEELHKDNIPILAEFGMRRAPGMDSANLASRIAVELGMKTSNMNLYNEFKDSVIGTFPHAFVQYFTGNKESLEEKIREEINLWTQIIDTGISNIILPDTNDFYNVIEGVFKKTKRKDIIVRIDSGDFLERTKYLADKAKQYNKEVKVILSGDLNKEKIIETYNRFKKEGLEKLIFSYAIGTQVVNNIKPLSIVYKVVEVNNNPVTKLSAKGKGYEPGRHIVVKEDNDFYLAKGDTLDNDLLIEKK